MTVVRPCKHSQTSHDGDNLPFHGKKVITLLGDALTKYGVRRWSAIALIMLENDIKFKHHIAWLPFLYG